MSEGIGLVGSLGLLGLAVAGVVGVVNFLLSTTSKEPHANVLADLQGQRAASEESYVARQKVLSMQYGSSDPERYKEELKKLDEAHKTERDNIDKQIKKETEAAEAAKAHTDATKKATDALNGKSPGFTPGLQAATEALTTFTLGLGAMPGGVGGFGGGGAGGIPGAAGAHETEYGPAVAGDQPGQATYDWNSYHHIGAWPGTTGPLRPGDVALGRGAQAQYHVQPGQSFMTASGHWVRFADRSGSKDPFNIDYFKGAAGGIVRRPSFGLVGEAGPEAILPLSKAGGFGGVNVTVNFGSISTGERDPRGLFREFAESIAAEVHRVIGDEHRRSAVV